MNALDYIAEERRRQVVQEGFTAEHDRQHDGFELEIAAACYAVHDTDCSVVLDEDGCDAWPWAPEWDKREKHGRLTRLIKAGALIAAALDNELRMNGEQPTERPRIVCLCGSTRFWREFQRASLAETLAGKIVLSIGAASGTDDEHFGNLPREEYERVKAMLDELHLRKIDLADEVLVLNVGGYIGESTRRELAYARSLGKPVRWLEPERAVQELAENF